MKIKSILKLLSFFMIVLLSFDACSNKGIVKKTEKLKTKTIDEILVESFEYNENQKIYKNKFDIVNEDDANNLLAKFENFCSSKEGQLIGGAYFIDKDYVRSYTNNKAGVCEVNGEPIFMIHQSSRASSIFYSVVIDEDIMKTYYIRKKKQDFQIEQPVIKESLEEVMHERKEIQRREAAREQKTKLLLSQKNQKTMTFFDSYRFAGSEASCSKRCYDINIKNNGFKTLKDALSNNWQFVSKIEETEETLDNNCTCKGSSVLLKK